MPARPTTTLHVKFFVFTRDITVHQCRSTMPLETQAALFKRAMAEKARVEAGEVEEGGDDEGNNNKPVRDNAEAPAENVEVSRYG